MDSKTEYISIVIKIPSAMYDWLKTGFVTEEDYKKLLEVVKNGIILPKAGSCEDAIGRRALRARFDSLDKVYEGISEEEKHEAYIYGQIIRAIDDAPPVTPKPKTGKWIKYAAPRCGEQHYKCTNCDDYVNFGQYGDYYTKNFKFCPHCGAKMEGESE